MPGETPVSARTASRSGPTTSPGAPSDVQIRAGSPIASISSVSQVRRRTSSSAVVEALVTSLTRVPDSQNPIRSGMRSMEPAAARAGVPRAAASW